MNKIDTYWGGNEDIADDVSLFYERITGKSSVMWSDNEGLDIFSTLDNRPQEYNTYGFTDDFEKWGKEECKRAIDAGMSSRVKIITWIIDHASRGIIYAYFVEDHEGDDRLACSVEDECHYGYWQFDASYGDLEAARERMRQDYAAYRKKDNLSADCFEWRETTYGGHRVWECYDKNYPYGWKIVEMEVK